MAEVEQQIMKNMQAMGSGAIPSGHLTALRFTVSRVPNAGGSVEPLRGALRLLGVGRLR